MSGNTSEMLMYRIDELDDWIHLVTTKEWKHFLSIMRNHQKHLQGEVNRYVRGNDFHNAVRAEAKLEDSAKIFELVNQRMAELQKDKEK